MNVQERTILRLLNGAVELYGLQMIEMAEKEGLQRGVIYIHLQNLEEQMFITSRKEDALPGLLPRRIYRITEAGKTLIAEAPEKKLTTWEFVVWAFKTRQEWFDPYLFAVNLTLFIMLTTLIYYWRKS